MKNENKSNSIVILNEISYDSKVIDITEKERYITLKHEPVKTYSLLY